MAETKYNINISPEPDFEVSDNAVSAPGSTFKENSYPPQEIINGNRQLFIRMRIHAQIILILLRNYRSLSTSIHLLKHLFRFRKSFFGESKVMKYAHVDGKYYLGMYIPALYSSAFEAFILGEVNRVMPLGQKTNRFTSLLLAITKKCALQCEHCSEWATLNAEEVLSVSDIITIIDKFQESGTAQIHFSGGEPLQRMSELPAIIRHASIKSECWILTSGHLLTYENALKLKSAGLTGVIVSIDHFDPETHNKFRGSARSYEWAEQAVRSAIHSNLVTAVSICVTRSFVCESNLFAYAEMAKKMGVSYIQIFEPKSVGHYQGKDVELNENEKATLESFFITMNNDRKYRSYPIVLYHGYYQRRIGCLSAGSRHLYVNSEGDLYDCSFCRTKSGNALYEDINILADQMKAKGCSKYKSLPF